MVKLKFADHLSHKQIRLFNQLRKSLRQEEVKVREQPKQQVQPKPKKKEEKIDWEELMGSKDRGMKRKKGGALTRA